MLHVLTFAKLNELQYPCLGRYQTAHVTPHVPNVGQCALIRFLFDSVCMACVAPVFPNIFFSSYRSRRVVYTSIAMNWENDT